MVVLIFNRTMLRTFLLLWLMIQLSFRGSEGDYRVLVSVHSLVLLESRCAECYDAGGGSVQRNSCCDEVNNITSCPNSCDILLRFCELSDLSQFNLADGLLGTKCPRTPLSSHFDDLLGFDLKAGETYSNSNREALQGGLVFSSPVVYNGTGQWRGAQFSMLVVDRDPGGIDLIDYFSIPINISAGSSLTSNFTGAYNYTQLELTIEVTCTAQNNMDESCVCVPGFTGPLCEENTNECIRVTCSNRGQCVDEVNGFHCECSPGFTGQLCEIDIDNCTCGSRGRCVDEVISFSCVCDPGYTGAACDTEMTSSSSTAAIAGGVIGGLVAAFSLIIITTLLLLFIIKSRTKKAFGQAATQDNDLHDYDEVDNETIIETKECVAYAVQKKVDLESNPAYIYAEVGGDQVATVEMRETVAYDTQGAVATTEATNPIYQTVLDTIESP